MDLVDLGAKTNQIDLDLCCQHHAIDPDLVVSGSWAMNDNWCLNILVAAQGTHHCRFDADWAMHAADDFAKAAAPKSSPSDLGPLSM